MTAVQRAASEEWIRFGRERVLVRSVPGDPHNNAPPVLLINGIGAHTRMWGLMERTLTDRHVISFDAPGAGRSSTPLGIVSVRRLAHLAVHVLDHWDVKKVDAVGYSMGGIILQQLLADRPARIRRAVLVGTTPGVGAVYGPAMSVLNVSTPVRFLSDRLYARSIGSLVGGRARTDPQWISDHLPVRLLHRPALGGYSRQVLSLSTWSGLPLLEHIRQPVLVVAGDDDPLAPVANAMMLAHGLPNARLHVMPGEGHLMPLDDRSAVPAMIRDFLAAPDHEESAPWRRGRTVDAADLDAALVGKRLQLQLGVWGAASALHRRRWLRRGRA
jgi:pimeloyl-ACP methyl ester carboxylesterase